MCIYKTFQWARPCAKAGHGALILANGSVGVTPPLPCQVWEGSVVRAWEEAAQARRRVSLAPDREGQGQLTQLSFLDPASPPLVSSL